MSKINNKATAEGILHPDRYNRGGLEVWDIEKAFAAAPEHNIPPFVEHLRMGAVEYILRAWDKGGTLDIAKAVVLLNRALVELGAAPDPSAKLVDLYHALSRSCSVFPHPGAEPCQADCDGVPCKFWNVCNALKPEDVK